MPFPTEIRYDRAAKTLHVAYEDGASYALPAELLRVESPSAEVQGHSPHQKKTIAGRRHVGIMTIEAVGNYAVRLIFDDMHDTGIFTWEYLAELGRDQDKVWAAYLDALARQGLSRDP